MPTLVIDGRNYRPLAQIASETDTSVDGLKKWAYDGYELSDGTRIYLDLKGSSRRWMASLEDVGEFVDRVSADKLARRRTKATRARTIGQGSLAVPVRKPTSAES